jgi:hypothetical protein
VKRTRPFLDEVRNVFAELHNVSYKLVPQHFFRIVARRGSYLRSAMIMRRTG